MLLRHLFKNPPLPGLAPTPPPQPLFLRFRIIHSILFCETVPCVSPAPDDLDFSYIIPPKVAEIEIVLATPASSSPDVFPPHRSDNVINICIFSTVSFPRNFFLPFYSPFFAISIFGANFGPPSSRIGRGGVFDPRSKGVMNR